MNYDPQSLAFSYALRSKIFSWSESFLLCEKLPSEIIKDIIKTELNNTSDLERIDPLWLYTQSAKNYSFDFQVLLANYTNFNFTKVAFDFYGFSSKNTLLSSSPIWAKHTYNNQWFERQKRIAKLSVWMKTIPGIKNIFLVGSSSLEVAQKNSDIDLAIQCNKGFCLVVRFYIKILLKLFNVDVHPFSIGVYNSFRKSINSNYKSKNVANFKNRSGLKIDAGLFFEDFTQLEKFFTRDIRQLWLWQALSLGLDSFPKSDFGFCNYNLKSNKFELIFIKIIFCILFPILYVLSISQLFLYKIIKKQNINRPVEPNFISFYPLFYEDSYLKSYHI